MYITCMQIGQMIAGVVITGYGFVYHTQDPECAVVPKVVMCDVCVVSV